MYESLRLLAAGRTVILITHRLASVRNCDRIVLLHRGEVAEQGTHGELIDRAGRYAELYALQERMFAGREAGRGPVCAGGVADAVTRVDEPRVSVRPGGGS